MNTAYFNIFTSISQATIIVKAVLLILLIFSIYSWAIIFSKIILFIKYNRLLTKIYSYTKHSSDDINVLTELFSKHKDNPYLKALKFFITYKATLFHNNSVSPVFMDAVYNMLYENNLNLENKLSYLATIGTISPFIGLLGTVFGIINSFESIGITTSVSLTTIAPGIAEALYATAFGLFVSIPAAFFYNIFTNKLENYKELQNTVLHSIILFIFNSNIDNNIYSKSSINESTFRSLDFLQGEKNKLI